MYTSCTTEVRPFHRRENPSCVKTKLLHGKESSDDVYASYRCHLLMTPTFCPLKDGLLKESKPSVKMNFLATPQTISTVSDSFFVSVSTMLELKLTDLPIELQSHIVSKLFTPPCSSSKAPPACTIQCIHWINDMFTDDMLHTAQASNDLSRAVIHSLGPHAKVLSFLRSTRLSEWISLLGNHLKAFGLTGATVLDNCEEECEELCKCDNLHKGMLKTLKALYTNDVSLLALDVEDLEITDPYRAEEIAEILIKAIQRSGSSLTEIALHVNRASAIALPVVTLPNLKVAQICSNDFDFDDDVELSDLPSHSKLLADILEGLNGHADRNAIVSTVRELRLYGIDHAPTVDRKSCSSLFSAVQKLILICGPTSKHNEIAGFIANFQTLKTLEWDTGLICLGDMNKVLAGCPELDSLELAVRNKHILPGDIPVAQNSSTLNNLFASFRGKLQRFDTQSNLSCSQIHSLGGNNPNLRSLKMEIDYASVKGLYSLLDTHCRNLRQLKLRYSTDAADCLGPSGWPVFARAVCSASDKLREISFEGDRTGPILESATYEMVEAIIDILEFMGDRASSIEFRVPINTQNPFTVMDAISRTLNVAKIHCRSIHTLCLDYIQDYSLGGYLVDIDQNDRLMDSFGLILRLKQELNLRTGTKVDLGNISALL